MQNFKQKVMSDPYRRDYEEGLLRIAQEALTNAVKHAKARNFKATLSISVNKIQLRLVDDGRGF